MKTTTKVHRAYQPLTTAVTLEVKSDGGLTQQYDAETQTYSPNRTKTPLVIRPVVNAIARDGSWENGNCNGKLANCVWHFKDKTTANGNVVSKGYGTMETNESSTNGTLTFKRNIASGENIAIWFEAELADERMNTNIAIKSDEVILSTNEKAMDEIMLSFSSPVNQVYNPLLDKEAMREWAAANNITTMAEPLDTNGYTRAICPILHIGTKTYDGRDEDFIDFMIDEDNEWTGFYKIEKKVGASFVPVNIELDGLITADIPDIQYIDFFSGAIVFNCLVMGDEEVYRVTLVYKGVEKNSVTLTFTRNRPAFDVQLTNKAPLDGRDKRRDEAIITYSGGKLLYGGVDCSEAVLDIKWLTSTKYNTDVEHCYGREGVLDLTKLTVGKEVNGAGWLETSVDIEYKGQYEVATDNNDETFTDNNNIVYIIN